MPNHAVIDIDISDGQFKSFYELFKQFEDKLEKMPESWKRINASSNAATEAIAAGSGALAASLNESTEVAKALGRNLRDATEAQKQFGHATHVGKTNLQSMAKDAKALADSVFGIGKFLFKFGAIGVGSGIAGLFGLDELAKSTVANQRGGRTLGLTTGQFRAFGTDLGRYIDPGTLSNVANAQNSYVGRVWLARATGMNQDAVEDEDAGTLSAKLALRAHDWWANTPVNQRTNANLLATGFTQSGMTMADVRRQGNTPRSELERGLSTYTTDSQLLNINNATNNAWFNFSRQIKLAGQTLETTFTKRLVALSGPLGGLITNVEKDFGVLVDSVFTKAHVEALGKGIDTFTKYMGSAEFRDSVKSLAGGLVKISTAVAKALYILDPNTTSAGPFASTQQGTAAANLYDRLESGASHLASPTSPVGKAIHWWATFNGVDPGLLKEPASSKLLFSQLEAAQGIPNGTLSALADVESSFNAKATSNKGAQGEFQLMPAVSKALGLTNPYDPIQSAMGASVLFRQLQTRFKGDFRKEVAAYISPPNEVDADVKKYGANWESHLPAATQQYITKMLAVMAQINRNASKPVNIAVTNKSGTNVAISTNAGSL